MKLFTTLFLIFLISSTFLHAQAITDPWFTVAAGSQPQAIAADVSGNVYTANGYNNTISKIDATGAGISAWATLPSGAGPRSIVADASGNIYTANYGNSTITKINSSGTIIQTWNLSTKPFNVAIDASGNIYTVGYINNNPGVSSDRVIKISASGTLSDPWVSLTTGTAPQCVTVDASGNVYTGNYNNNSGTISKITPSGSLTLTWISIGSGYVGYLYAGASGNLYATTSGSTVLKITPAGTVTDPWATLTNYGNGYKLVGDAFENLYFVHRGIPAQTMSIGKITSSGTVNESWATITDYAGAITIDSSGNVYTAPNTVNINFGVLCKIATYNTWLGGTSADWGTAANWSFGTVPVSTDIVHIPSGTTYSPGFTGFSATMNSLLIEPGVTLSNSGGSMTVSNAFTNNGTLKFGTMNVGGALINNGDVSNGGTIILNGSSAQTMSGIGTIANLNIQNSTGVSISSGLTTITGTLIPTSGTFTTNDFLTIGATGSVATGSGTISGNVTVQEDITAQRGWRILGSPFSTAVSLASLATASNIDITYGGSNAYGGISAASAETYSPSTNSWPTLSSGSSWAANSAIALFIRGAKGEGITGSGPGWVSGTDYGGGGPSAVTLSATGTLNTSGFNYTISAGNFNMVPNPFAATISVQGVIGSGTNFYYYNPAAGAADSKTKGGSYVPVLAGTNAYIPKYGCFVYTPASGTTLSIPTTAISIGSPTAAVMGTYPNNQLIELIAESNGVYYDKMFVQLDANSTAIATDSKDLKKFYNDNLNLYSLTPDSNRMAIDARDVLSVVPLGISALAGTYDLKLNSNSLPEGTTLYLDDQYLKTQTELAVGDQYPFTINADTASKGENRFKLVFNNKQSLSSTPDYSNGTLTAKILGNVTSNNLVAVEIAGSNGTVTIDIKDMSGKALGVVKVMDGIQYINVGPAVSGMLILKISDSKSSVVQKLIKL
jgi:streptogramin lyase